jgi:adenine nucleotide transporter 17
MSLSEVFSYEAFVHAISGTAGGSAAMTLFYPLDVIRTHQQVHKGSISQLIQEEGAGTLYRGLSGVLISLGCSNFVYFYTNNLLKVLTKRYTGQKNVTIPQNLLIATLAGVVNVLVTCPLWVSNTRLKLQSNKSQEGSRPYKGMKDALTRISKEEGLEALWGGTASSLMLVSNPVIHFVVYDKVKSIFSKSGTKKVLSSGEIFLIGAIAKALATIITYPIQVAQSRQRALKDKQSSTFASTFKILYDIFKKDGVLGWFAGMNVKLVQTVLTAAFQFMCYEKIQETIFSVMGNPGKAHVAAH